MIPPFALAVMEVWEKSETIDPEIRAWVYSLVTALGGRSTYDDSYGKMLVPATFMQTHADKMQQSATMRMRS